jgi:hypothetical protein
MQAVPRTFRTSIEGKVIYALDDRSFKKIQQRMVTPLSTAVVSLGVLCGFPWENYAVAMWCGVSTLQRPARRRTIPNSADGPHNQRRLP